VLTLPKVGSSWSPVATRKQNTVVQVKPASGAKSTRVIDPKYLDYQEKLRKAIEDNDISRWKQVVRELDHGWDDPNNPLLLDELFDMDELMIPAINHGNEEMIRALIFRSGHAPSRVSFASYMRKSFWRFYRNIVEGSTMLQ
jgi:hypothetical protein